MLLEWANARHEGRDTMPGYRMPEKVFCADGTLARPEHNNRFVHKHEQDTRRYLHSSRRILVGCFA